MKCRYLPGNQVKDFQKNTNLNPKKLAYKEMKQEIEKKLENESWLSPKQIEEWINKEFPIDKHLSYGQIDQIVQSWRKKILPLKKPMFIIILLPKTGFLFKDLNLLLL